MSQDPAHEPEDVGSEEPVPTILDYDSLEPVTIPVRFNKKRYLLCEASEGAYCVYQSAVFKSLKMEGGKPVAAEGISETDALLISQCLYEVGPDDTLRLTPNSEPDPKYLVPLTTVKRWPRRITKDLYKQLRRISGMDEKRSTAEVQKELARLQQELADLTESSKNGQATSSPAKNELSATTDS